MNNPQLLERKKGEITYFNHQKKYGFIEAENGDSYFFYSDVYTRKEEVQSGVVSRYFSPFAGDLVDFLVRPSVQKLGEMEPYGLQWLGNKHKEALIEKIETEGPLLGEIIQANENKFFIRPEKFNCLLKIIPSPWDEDLSAYLDGLEGAWELFQITRKRSLQKLAAILVEGPKNTVYQELYEKMIHQELVDVRILSVKRSGVKFETLDYGLKGFADSLNLDDPGKVLWLQSLRKDMIVSGYISYIFLKYPQIRIDFFEPIGLKSLPA